MSVETTPAASRFRASEVVTRPAHRVVAGRFDERPGYRVIRPHGTTDWLLLVTVAGRGRVRTRDAGDLVTGAGEVIAIEPLTGQDYGTDSATGRWTFRWAHAVARPDWEPLLEWPTVAPGISRLELDPAVHERVVQDLDRAIAAGRSGLHRSEQFAANAIENALLWCDTQNPQRPVLDPRLLTVLEYLADRLDQQHTVPSLARIGGLSASRLAHIAREQLGRGLIAHLDSQRMELARQLLQMTELSVTEVSRRVGFTDRLYFSRRFRRATGLTPTGYREQARG